MLFKIAKIVFVNVSKYIDCKISREHSFIRSTTVERKITEKKQQFESYVMDPRKNPKTLTYSKQCTVNPTQYQSVRGPGLIF